MFEESKIKECFFTDNISEMVSRLTEDENKRFTLADGVELLGQLAEANSKTNLQGLSRIERIGFLVKQGFFSRLCGSRRTAFYFLQ